MEVDAHPITPSGTVSVHATVSDGRAGTHLPVDPGWKDVSVDWCPQNYPQGPAADLQSQNPAD